MANTRALGFLLLCAAGAGFYFFRNRKSGDSGDALDEIIVTAKKIGSGIADAIIPRGLRNNNPGNIDWIENAERRWRGMYAKAGRFGVFDTAANGVRAIGGEIRASLRKGQTNITQIINEWAPPVENNTDSYINAVSNVVGKPPLATVTVNDIPLIAAAIIRHENGYNPWSIDEITEWVNS